MPSARAGRPAAAAGAANPRAARTHRAAARAPRRAASRSRAAAARRRRAAGHAARGARCQSSRDLVRLSVAPAESARCGCLRGRRRRRWIPPYCVASRATVAPAAFAAAAVAAASVTVKITCITGSPAEPSGVCMITTAGRRRSSGEMDQPRSDPLADADEQLRGHCRAGAEVSNLRGKYTSFGSTISPASSRFMTSGSAWRMPAFDNELAFVRLQRVTRVELGEAVGLNHLPIGAARHDLASNPGPFTVPPGSARCAAGHGRPRRVPPAGRPGREVDQKLRAAAPPSCPATVCSKARPATELKPTNTKPAMCLLIRAMLARFARRSESPAEPDVRTVTEAHEVAAPVDVELVRRGSAAS